MAREFQDYYREVVAELGEPTDLMSAFDMVQAAARRLMYDRQEKYGSSNISAFGLQGVVVRATDKLARARTMVWEGTDDNQESVLDTMCDLANYGCIGALLGLENEDGTKLWDLPFKKVTTELPATMEDGDTLNTTFKDYLPPGLAMLDKQHWDAWFYAHHENHPPPPWLYASREKAPPTDQVRDIVDRWNKRVDDLTDSHKVQP